MTTVTWNPNVLAHSMETGIPIAASMAQEVAEMEKRRKKKSSRRHRRSR